MNLSKSTKVKIKDSSSPDEELTHIVGTVTMEARLAYDRCRLKGYDDDGNLRNIDDAEFVAIYSAALVALYDQVIIRVEGYTIDDVDLMDVENWRELVPFDHKVAVAKYIIPTVTISKNESRKSAPSSPERISEEKTAVPA